MAGARNTPNVGTYQLSRGILAVSGSVTVVLIQDVVHT